MLHSAECMSWRQRNTHTPTYTQSLIKWPRKRRVNEYPENGARECNVFRARMYDATTTDRHSKVLVINLSAVQGNAAAHDWSINLYNNAAA